MPQEGTRVVIRVRPPIKGEQARYDPDAVDVEEDTNTITVGDVRCSFDKVFGTTATQDDVYDYLGRSVEAVLTGVNCTVFAYGQTGSGKTYTMLGEGLEDALLTGEEIEASMSSNWGVIPRAMELLFRKITAAADDNLAATVHCSYIQIYNDKLFDLLQDRRRRRPLVIRETTKGRSAEVYVQNLAEYRVSSAEDVLMLLQIGGRNRAVRGTEYNEASSRSHALLQVDVEVETQSEGGATVIRRAKLNLVDLAGSEKWNTDVDIGRERAKELTHINSSLSALGNCISALTDKKRSHIPYRDSKLTRLLQDSLGGNTRTTVVACLSPLSDCTEESISTLTFADRARQIMTRVRANEVVDDAVLLARAQKEIKRLRGLIQRSDKARLLARLQAEVEVLRDENKRLKAQYESASRASTARAQNRPRPSGASSRGPSRHGSKRGAALSRQGSGNVPTAGMDFSKSTGALPPLTPDRSAVRQLASAGDDKPIAAGGTASRARGSSDGFGDGASGAGVDALELNMALAGSGGSGSGGEMGDGSATARDVDALSFDDDDSDEADQSDLIDDLRSTLRRGDMNPHDILRKVADAEESVGRELTGLISSVDSIAAERRLLEEQLATLEKGMNKAMQSYLAGEEDEDDDDDDAGAFPVDGAGAGDGDDDDDVDEEGYVRDGYGGRVRSSERRRPPRVPRAGGEDDDTDALGFLDRERAVSGPGPESSDGGDDDDDDAGDEDADGDGGAGAAGVSGLATSAGGDGGGVSRTKRRKKRSKAARGASAGGAPLHPGAATEGVHRRSSGASGASDGSGGARSASRVLDDDDDDEYDARDSARRSRGASSGEDSTSKPVPAPAAVGSGSSAVAAIAPPLPSPETARTFAYGKSDVGARVKIWSNRYDEWSEGTVTAYDPLRDMHMVTYESGDRKWHVMRDKKFEVVAFAKRRKNASGSPKKPSRTSSKKQMRKTMSSQRMSSYHSVYGVGSGSARGSGSMRAAFDASGKPIKR